MSKISKERRKKFRGRLENGYVELEGSGINDCELRALLDRCDELEALADWQPMESAPKDGTPILVYAGENGFKTSKGNIGVAQWGEVGRVGDPHEWIARDCCDQVTTYKPSHWVPLPEPPK